jgi:P-type E1-E2 ATPase
VLKIEIPGQPTLRLDHLLLDVNGTLAWRGRLIDGVEPRIRALATDLDVRLLTADTFGTAAEIAAGLGVALDVVASGAQKAALAMALGAGHVAAIGNGRNDVAMLRKVALAITITGREGAAVAAVRAADITCASVLDALDLLLEPRLLAATLRA